MRAVLMVLVPLMLLLGAIAWGASVLVEHTARRWFDRDTRMRAELAVSGAREGLERALRKGERPRVRRILGELARDERVLGVAACDPDGVLLATTPEYPDAFDC